MIALRLRRSVHRGSVLASGLLIELAAPGGRAALAAAPAGEGDGGGDGVAGVAELEARRRILALSALVAEVRRIGDAAPAAPLALVALFHAPVRLRCEVAAGAPLVRQGHLLSTAPLSPDELGELPAHREAVVIAAGGAVRTLPLETLPREDPSTWLDVSELELQLELQSLGEVAAQPRAALTAVPLQARAALGVAPLAEEGQEVWTAMRARRAAAWPGSAAGPGDDAEAATLLGAAGGGGWWSRWWGAIASRLASLGGGAAGEGGGGGGAGAAGHASGRGGGGRALVQLPAQRSWLARALGAVGNFSKRALMRTRLREVIGRRYARYLERMFEMFDANQLDEALRHAIPLGGHPDDAGKSSDLSLSPPTPRADLSLSLAQQRRARMRLAFGADLYDALEARYRRAFERLREQGDIEKAAFVLAELLHAEEEAVSFLEQHGKLRLAAELAEARQLPAGLVIRQWFLARDPARALRLARRSGAFADAVTRLEASRPEEARALRLLWADALADSGAYAAAIDVIWSLPGARALALRWIDRAIELGGTTGATMLARKARALPDAFAEVRARALRLLDDDDAEPAALEAFVNELLQGEAAPQLQVLMRAAARRLLREEREVGTSKLLPRLLESCGDPALRIDAVPLLGALLDARQRAQRLAPAALAARVPPLDHRWLAADRGAVALFDACDLPDGKLLVALGELGAWLLSREGRVLARFAEPAHRLVISDHGDRAILVAPRGQAMRLSRVELVDRRARHWCDVQLDHFATDYDGATWFVSRGGAVYAVEATAEGWQHAWMVEERGAQVSALARDAASLQVWFVRASLATAGSGTSAAGVAESASRTGDSQLSIERSSELWRYELPRLVLRQRTGVSLTAAHPRAVSASGDGTLAGWFAMAGQPTLVARSFAEGRWSTPRWTHGGALLAPAPSCNAKLAVFASRFPAPPSELGGHDDGGDAEAGAPDAVSETRTEGVALTLFDLEESLGRARIVLHGPGLTVGARLQGDHLLVFDSVGRLLVISLHDGAELRRWRLT